jgi:hypothetical protein
MQDIKLQNFGANNPHLSNIRNPLKAKNWWFSDIYIEIGYHYGKNKTYLELCYIRKYDCTIGRTLLFNTVEEAKAFVEKAFNGKIVEVAT